MSLYQTSVVKKYLKELDSKLIKRKYKEFQNYFGNPEIQKNIRDSKEEQFQEGFLRELFVNIFNYTLNPKPNFNLTRELRNTTGSQKVDGAILKDNHALAVIELKGTSTNDLDKIEAQAFGYKNHHPKCVYVITSNFEKLRFYIQNAVDHIDFNLFDLSFSQFSLMWLCLEKDNLLNGLPFKIKTSSLLQEEIITKNLYSDYSKFRESLYQNLLKNNPNNDKLLLFNKTQKLLDRFLFIFFAEDRLLLPPNSISQILDQWTTLKELDAAVPLYDRFKKFFGYLNTGFKNNNYEIFAYNGGLFEPDKILDNITINDEILYEHTLKLSKYDFETEVDVNILGHIFEHSLGEIEYVQAEIKGETLDKRKTKRKKDGIFYTPKYITQYIIENTIGKLCEEKRKELDIQDEEYSKKYDKKDRDIVVALDDKLTTYRDWLLDITILDPACGSGAFLNQALDFLITEHRKIDELKAELYGGGFVFRDVTSEILENNIYGVDINEESVEIAKLSLWLRTAQKGRKLNTLSNNIKCGNSLIASPEVVGDKAFNWEIEFPKIIEKGGFKVVIGNPPYVRSSLLPMKEKEFYQATMYSPYKQYDIYILFYELGIKLLQENGILGFITPNKFFLADYGKKIREYILKNTTILDIADVSNMNIFTEASVYPNIITLRKTINSLNKITIKSKIKSLSDLYLVGEQIHQIEYLRKDEFVINTNIKNLTLIKNIEQKGVPLGKRFDISRGFRPPKADLQKTTLEKGSYPYLIGSDLVAPYRVNWSGNIVYFEKNQLLESQQLHTYLQPKILIRDIGLNFNAFYDSGKYLCLKTIYFIYGGCSNSLKFTTGLLNSSLLNFYFKENYSTMHISGGYLRFRTQFLKKIPIIPYEDNENHLRIVSKVESITLQNSALQDTIFTMSNLIHSKYDYENLVNKFQNWHKLDFKTFLFELNKVKTKLSLSEEAEWMQYFNKEKQKVTKLELEINKTEQEINQLVYKLYDLTEEEIKIVEEKI